MLKILLLSLSLSIMLNAVTIATQSIYSNKFIGLKKTITSATYESLKKYQQKQVDLAVVRGDVLSNVYNAENKFKRFTDYTVIAQISDSYIYLVTKDFLISSIYDLRNKTIAVGNRNNLAASYLMRIAKKYGVSQEINIKVIDEIKAIKKLKKGAVDAIFVFASKGYSHSLKGLKINNIPNDFITVLKKQYGLNKTSTKSGMITMKASNFVIVSNKLNYDELYNIVKKFKRKKVKIIKSLNPKFGLINPSVNIILRDIEKNKKIKIISKSIINNIDVKKDIEFNFIDTSVKIKSLKLSYYIINNTNKIIDVKFDSIETKSLDEYPFKERHIFKINKNNFSIKANSKKMFYVSVLRRKDMPKSINGEYLFKINNKIEKFKFKINGVN